MLQTPKPETIISVPGIPCLTSLCFLCFTTCLIKSSLGASAPCEKRLGYFMFLLVCTNILDTYSLVNLQMVHEWDRRDLISHWSPSAIFLLHIFLSPNSWHVSLLTVYNPLESPTPFFLNFPPSRYHYCFCSSNSTFGQLIFSNLP